MLGRKSTRSLSLFYFVFFNGLIDRFEAFSNTTVIIDRVNVCKEPYRNVESPLKNLRVVHFNRTVKLLNFDIAFKRPIDENIEASLIIEKLTDSGWKKISIFPKITDVCNFYRKNYSKQWIAYITAMGVANPDICPIPPGSYSMKNYPLVNTVMENSLPYRCQIIVTIVLQDPKKKILVQCTEFAMRIE